MKYAGPGPRGRRDRPAGAGHTAGFSLLELLVALFIVVLITSMVTLTTSSGGQDIRLEAQVRSLANVAGYAMDEAQMRGVDYGILLLERQDQRGETVYGFGWRERRPEGWRQPRSDSDVFSEQVMTPDIELYLELEDSPVGELSLSEGDTEATASPQVVLYASGETTPGALELRRVESGELLWRVEWDLLGRFSLLRWGHPEEDDSDY